MSKNVKKGEMTKSQDLPVFDHGSQYEVQVSRVVEIGPGMVLRPSSAKITLSGEKAQEIRDALVSARKVNFLEN